MVYEDEQSVQVCKVSVTAISIVKRGATRPRAVVTLLSLAPPILLACAYALLPNYMSDCFKEGIPQASTILSLILASFLSLIAVLSLSLSFESFTDRHYVRDVRRHVGILLVAAAAIGFVICTVSLPDTYAKITGLMATALAIGALLWVWSNKR